MLIKIVDDPSGNSFVENKLAPKADPNLTVEYYERSEDQNKQLGLSATGEVIMHGVCAHVCIEL